MPKKREYIAISGYIVDSHLYPKGEQVIAALDDGAMIAPPSPSGGRLCRLSRGPLSPLSESSGGPGRPGRIRTSNQTAMNGQL